MAGRPHDVDAPWRRAAVQVLVADLAAPVLAEADLHHLGRVLRLRPGTEVCAADGAGGWRPTRFAGTAALDPDGGVERVPAPTTVRTVAFAPAKGDRPELVVQKLTELGVDRMVLVEAARSVVRWDPSRAGRQAAKLRRVAAEACCQCRRLWLPELDLGDAAGPVRPAALWGFDGVAVAEPGGGPLTAGTTTVVVGPEGGWSPEELEEAAAAGAGRVGLGPHVLRAETAAIAAGVLLSTLRVAN